MVIIPVTGLRYLEEHVVVAVAFDDPHDVAASTVFYFYRGQIMSARLRPEDRLTGSPK
jgi:hypothetical protein